jgi:hypothetical protein
MDDSMKFLLKLIKQEFDLEKCDTTFDEVNAEIAFIQDTYIHDASDLVRTLAYINPDGKVQLVYSN